MWISGMSSKFIPWMPVMMIEPDVDLSLVEAIDVLA
jgi:hypothetical protein